MGIKVQARLDEETRATLDRVARGLGVSRSEVVRRGILLLAEEKQVSAAARMIGIGVIASGPGDMATNKKYLEGFGRKGKIGSGQKEQRARKAG
jgi:Arc/MetJ-type ribon-helix-helix transcriptional regulator